MIVGVGANALSALLGTPLGLILAKESHTRQLNQFLTELPIWLVLTSNTINFGVPIAIMIWYTRPISRVLDDPTSANDLVRRRVLNAPLVVALVGLLGWMLAVIQSLFIMLLTFSNPELSFIVLSLALTAMLGLVTFVLIYYALEYLARRSFVPLFFPDGRLSEVRGALQLSVQRRFGVFYMAVGGIPLALMFLAYRAVAATSESNAKQWGVAIMMLVCISVGFLLTFFFARAYQGPLVAMKRAVDGLRAGNLDVPVPVLSHDELGHLGEGLLLAAAELKEKELIKETFGRVVDPEVRDHLLAGNLKLGGELRRAVLLYSDIRGFTSLSEEMRPDELVQLLNRYFEKMSACIKDSGGFVNRFIGDAILAVFNLPLEIPSPVESALDCALAMQRELEVLNLELQQEGRRTLAIGVGIHAGEVLAGNIGSAQRMEYTVIGDAVNVTARLEGLTKEYGCPVLVSAAVREALTKPQNYSLREVASVAVRGRERPVLVYSLEGPG